MLRRLAIGLVHLFLLTSLLLPEGVLEVIFVAAVAGLEVIVAR
jgi:hypothetical protein